MLLPSGLTGERDHMSPSANGHAAEDDDRGIKFWSEPVASISVTLYDAGGGSRALAH